MCGCVQSGTFGRRGGGKGGVENEGERYGGKERWAPSNDAHNITGQADAHNNSHVFLESGVVPFFVVVVLRFVIKVGFFPVILPTSLSLLPPPS